MTVLGVDPGVSETGWAVLDGAPGRPARLLGSGLIRTRPGVPLPERLVHIHAALAALVAEHRPAAVAVEEMFFLKAAHTVRATLQARGVVLLAAGQGKVPVSEYNPRQVKLALTGSGAAVKSQMKRMVRHALSLADELRPDDVSDAAAIALCHLRLCRAKSLVVLAKIGGHPVIASLRGAVLGKGGERVVLEAGGVGYEVLVNRSTSSRLPAEGGEAVLLISETTAMYGGGTTLYGFLTRDDRELFLAFKELPGTGAKKALDHLEKASRSLPDFRRAVAEGDSRALTTLFGFTKKTAERLLAGLKDKLGAAPAGAARPAVPALEDGPLSKALEALASLGYRPAECRAAIEDVQRDLAGGSATAEELVRKALRKL